MSYTKYYLYKKQVSYDNGVTWSDVTPLETTPNGSPIGTYQTLADCADSYSEQYLSFVTKEDGTFGFTTNISGNTVQYSLDDGITWSTLASGETTSLIPSGSTVVWKGVNPTEIDGIDRGVGKFSSSGQFEVKGNPMSILYGDDFIGVNSISDKKGAFIALFQGCSGLTNAENLSLDATTLSKNCYNYMFQNCTSLTKAPSVLPAENLSGASGCYEYMFYNCTSLTTAPMLSATTLSSYCCRGMFQNCSVLTTAPSLPATTLANECYQFMFMGCTNLTTAPQLPATTLTRGCYHSMFEDCTSLTTATTLHATTLATNCYAYMFMGCTSLTTAPTLPATTLADSCYKYMFQGCTSLTTAPTLPATTLANYCYQFMFNGCTSLNNITCLATDISASNCTYAWVAYVANNGTFTKAASMTSWSSGASGIPTNWTVQDAS